MTIASTVSSLEYTGDGSTTTFNVTFHFFVAADLAVYIRSADGETVTLKTITTHYTVTGTDTTSGSITFLTAPASGEKVVIVRKPAIKQETDYPATGKFPAESHEDALDRLTEIAQYLLAQLERSVRLTEGAEAQDMRIPAGSAAAYLGLDADGALTIRDGSGSTWHAVVGSGAPSSSVGIDGDIAINSDGAIYTKASGAWSATGVTISPPLTGDLAALEALSGTGLARRTGTSTWSVGTTVATAEIADDAVTYAKIQDVSATARVLGRKTAGAGVVEELSASELLDLIGSTRGQILYRGASGWAGLSPGTSGYVLQSGGAGADPSWASVSGTGDVTAAAAFANDNRLIRSDGTGKGVQASGITVDDSDNLTGVTKINGVTVRPAAPGVLIGNLTVTASVAASALTVALKTEAGTDASATDPIVIAFRSPTEATGTYSVLTITAAMSLTISSGSTMGATNNVAFPLWLVVFNDGGTARLGLINTVSGTNIFPLGAYAVASSTAEGGAGAADSAHVFYTGTAVTSKAYVTLARLAWTSGLGTVGTWSAGPSRIQLMERTLRLPGDTVQSIEAGTVSMTTGSTTVPADDTIPQSSEGNQYFSQAITPVSAAHVLRFTALLNGSVSTGSNALVVALFQDSTANALAAAWQNGVAAGAFFNCAFAYAMLAGTTSSTTFKIRAGPIAAGTYTLNGVGGARFMGGVAYSHFQITEIAT